MCCLSRKSLDKEQPGVCHLDWVGGSAQSAHLPSYTGLLEPFGPEEEEEGCRHLHWNCLRSALLSVPMTLTLSSHDACFHFVLEKLNFRSVHCALNIILYYQ